MCPTLARRNSGELPCPLVSLTRSWVRILSRAREGAGETRRVAAPSRPVPKNSGRRGGAFSISPAGRGLCGANLTSLALAQARKQRQIRAEYSAVQKEFRTDLLYRNWVKFTRRNRWVGLNLWLFYSVVYE